MDTKVERLLNPYNEAGILSKLSFWWLFDLFRLGFRNELTENNLYENVPDLKSERIVKIFQRKWKKMLIANDSSILKLLFKLYGLKFLLTTILNVSIEVFCKSIQVISLGELTSYFSVDQNKKSREEVFYYATGLVICLMVPTLSTNVYIFYVSKIGLKIRLGCSGLVFQKIIENSKKINGFNGKAIAILTNDVRQIINALTFGNFTFLGPFETIILGYLMYLEIGVAAFCGIIFMLLFLPFQCYCTYKNVKFFRSRSKFLDERLKITNEIIQNIETIKIHSWEKYFKNKIINIRDNELKSLWGILKIRAQINCLRVASVIAIFISLLIHCYMEKDLSARKVFMTSLIFTFISGSMIRFWTTSLTYWSNGFESLNRIREFLYSRNSIHLLSETKKSNDSYNSQKREHGIYLNDVKLEWDKENENDEVKFALYDINLELPDASLVVITGSVGSGKSTLLSLISGEIKAQSGNVEVMGKISYASQEPWIFEGTIKENIIFAEDYDEERYIKVLRICALQDDICKFSSGDLSIVGERGVNLSGGQRSRINLARAIYRKADIYLLDDPLSAVDLHVAKHIFDDCISQFLQGNICLLVTHQLQHFGNQLNHILIMSNGQIVKKGGFELLNDINDFMLPEKKYTSNLNEKKDKWNKIEKKLEFRKEHLEKGSIKLTIYKFILKMAGNWAYLTFVTFITIASTATAAGLNYLLSIWVNKEESKHLYQGTKDFIKIRNEYEIMYWCLVSIVIVLYIGRFFIINYTCLRISLNIHKSLVNAVLMTSMKFFSLNSSGQIITRFSKDLSAIDSELPTSLLFVIGLLTDVPAAVIITIIVNYWLLIPSTIITIIFCFIRMVFMRTSLPIKRIESSTQSPVNSHINQIVHGLATIRVSKAEKKMEQIFHKLQNVCASAFILDAAVYRCFSLWIEFFCTLYIAIIVYSFLFINDLFTSGAVGLAVFQCISIVQICQFGIKFTADLENQMTGVERIKEYCDLASESNGKTSGKNKWPSAACIEFKNVNLKYFDKDELILKNINFKIKAKEKIGIVGRTGSGKSSIVQAITRLAVNEGIIEIGGIDIQNLCLNELRANISIIPQNPVIFSGTIRSNLDPDGNMPDCSLWEALEDVELKVYIKSLPCGLDSKIADCGENLSVGQKQLICVARAILKRNRILILDEATANVDLETDRLIQKMLSTKFADCTVLSIAHRLDSIRKSDRILVMNNGKVMEFDTVQNLLNADKSFSKIY